MTGDGRNYGWDSVPVEAGWLIAWESGPGKVLAEGPHSQIAEDPERGWTQDF
jgi:hypothetical protein